MSGDIASFTFPRLVAFRTWPSAQHRGRHFMVDLRIGKRDWLFASLSVYRKRLPRVRITAKHYMWTPHDGPAICQ